MPYPRIFLHSCPRTTTFITACTFWDVEWQRDGVLVSLPGIPQTSIMLYMRRIPYELRRRNTKGKTQRLRQAFSDEMVALWQ